MTRLQQTRLEAKAICERWPLPESTRQKVLDRLMLAVESENTREALAACRGLLYADSLNLQEKLKGVPERHEHTINEQADVRAMIREMQKDPAYVDYLNKQAGEEHG
jgi:hypothetical protein